MGCQKLDTYFSHVLQIIDSEKRGYGEKKRINYYPFGLKHKGYNNVINGQHYPYGFGGKEEQNELGLEWLDFGFRNYDASLGRWMNLDPLAHRYSTNTPYSYALNNPIKFYDPDGLKVKNGDLERKERVDNRVKAGKKALAKIENKYGTSRRDFKQNGGKNWKSARKDYKNKKKAVKKLEKKSETLAENIKSTNKKINELKTNSPNLFNKLDNAVNEYGETVDIYFTSENVSFGNDGENKLKFDTETMNFAFGGMLFKFEFVRLTTIDFGVNTTEVSTKNVPSGDRTTLEVSKHELGHADYHIENTYKYYKYLQNKGILDQNGNVIRSYDGHDSDDQSGKRANKYGKLNDL